MLFSNILAIMNRNKWVVVLANILLIYNLACRISNSRMIGPCTSFFFFNNFLSSVWHLIITKKYMLRKGRDKQQRKLTRHEQRKISSFPREGPKGALPGRNTTSQKQPIYTEDREAGPKMLSRGLDEGTVRCHAPFWSKAAEQYFKVWREQSMKGRASS